MKNSFNMEQLHLPTYIIFVEIDYRFKIKTKMMSQSPILHCGSVTSTNVRFDAVCE